MDDDFPDATDERDPELPDESPEPATEWWLDLPI